MFFAATGWRLVRQVVADVLALAWIVVWWQIGRATDAVIRRLADPTRQGADLVDGLRGQLAEAATRAGELPVVGPGLRQPLDAMTASVSGLATQADAQAVAFERLATAAGWVVFVAPVLLVLVVWLPARVRFAVRARDARRIAALPHGRDLLALRALAHQPLRGLETIPGDPVAAWRAGDTRVIDALAELELARAGVRPGAAPPTVRPPAGGPPSR